MEEGLFKNKYRIKSARHEEWDYSQDGFYFITICTEKWKSFFGNIENEKMVLSELGKIVKNEWFKTREIRKNVKLDEFVVMPNHIHGIIQVLNMNVKNGTNDTNVETHCHASSANDPNNKNEISVKTETQSIASLQQGNKFVPQSNNLGAIIRGFKGA